MGNETVVVAYERGGVGTERSHGAGFVQYKVTEFETFGGISKQRRITVTGLLGNYQRRKFMTVPVKNSAENSVGGIGCRNKSAYRTERHVSEIDIGVQTEIIARIVVSCVHVVS